MNIILNWRRFRITLILTLIIGAWLSVGVLIYYISYLIAITLFSSQVLFYLLLWLLSMYTIMTAHDLLKRTMRCLL